MKRLQLLVLAMALPASVCVCRGQSSSPIEGTATTPARIAGPTTSGKSEATAKSAQMQVALDRLTQSNSDLLNLLKQQQAVLEDLQFDRRLQSRQIQSLEERLEDALQQNAELESKVAHLETAAALGSSGTPPATTSAQAGTSPAPSETPPPTTAPRAETPAPPASYLPPAGSDGPPGTQSWHRLFTLKGTDGQNTDLFYVQGRTWRVLWHNEDKPGKAYQNTSALFINAFPKDDTIPQKVCAKLGSGGDSTELMGPGNYYLKVEASGGSWELAVEDFH